MHKHSGGDLHQHLGDEEVFISIQVVRRFATSIWVVRMFATSIRVGRRFAPTYRGRFAPVFGERYAPALRRVVLQAFLRTGWHCS